ncbi:single-stranded DNA-binding protein [Mycolicibacterium doricum]|uniref:Single-stranded DNA-binding protein n=1 Tax=Mycolicibacterium doricum TaxID=126673 RepID=A0A1X1TCW3_9MYCO|nr:single-stranded DNA-binding protein [Mycolicibacterium doricum]MCV7267002.1 single-stranded DNA-binding protein [Mycolicibacterium doricum]ORV42414.1 single-stranded DNA-binding protein [Mycolicibacterium doricum]BBZ08485.1 single-stranded DNA-binding protein [Mycolicibacterium doricum]
MFETPITIVGNIVNNPFRQRIGDQEVIRFRMASNSRRRTADGAWEPGNSLFVSVSCWGRLVTGVGASLVKGDAVIVVGQVYTSEYDDREGVRRSSVEVRATAVGPDLSRCVARIETLRQPGTTGIGGAPEGAESGDDGGAVDADETHLVDPDAAEALPLSA